MDLANIISSLTGNNMIGEISKKFNIDPSKIVSVIKAAIPKFLAKMQQNASTSAGAAALAQALGNHAGQGFNINIEDGMKILGKIFGNNLNSTISGLSSQTNTTNDQVSNILASIAPNLLSILGKNGQPRQSAGWSAGWRQFLFQHRLCWRQTARRPVGQTD